jgi:hypothetical protein
MTAATVDGIRQAGPDAFDPLSIGCPTCTARPGQRCRVRKTPGHYVTPAHFQSITHPGLHLSRVDPDRTLRERGAGIRAALATVRIIGMWTVMDLLRLLDECEPDDVELAVIADQLTGTGRPRGGWCDERPECRDGCAYGYREHP